MVAEQRVVKLSTCCMAGVIYDEGDTDAPPRCGLCRKVTAVQRLGSRPTGSGEDSAAATPKKEEE